MILSFFQWIEGTGLAMAINESLYAYALIQSFHILSLALLGGAVLLVDLRILNLGMRGWTVEHLARVAYPWLLAGTIAVIVTGTLMFSSLAASKYYWNEAFWLKMGFLVLAIVFTFAVRQPIANAGEARSSTGVAKAVAAASALSWLVVGIMGRAIGFI